MLNLYVGRGYMSKVWVVGEALMDLIPVAGGERTPMVGGGPANTAKAIANIL
jgi:fructokinase